MDRAARLVTILMAMTALAALAGAQTKPIEDLPGDVAHWSSLPLEVPKAMASVGGEEGPISAVTWGPAKGTAVVIQTLTEDVWLAVKPEPDKPAHRRHEPVGPLFRYEF
jgi:hypothetical protein